MTQTCSNCRFSRPVTDALSVVCQRFPPTVYSVVDATISSCCPIIAVDYWCGEWREKQPYMTETVTPIPKARRVMPEAYYERQNRREKK